MGVLNAGDEDIFDGFGRCQVGCAGNHVVGFLYWGCSVHQP
jgi:hypothetical protein